MDYGERRRWIDAAIVLAQDPAASVLCPACAGEPLSTEEIQAYTGRMDMRIHCRVCGRGEWLLLRVASFDEGNRVELFEPHPDVPLPAGSKGIVYRIHDGRPARYEIEFSDDTGNAILVPGVPQTHLALDRRVLGPRKPRPDDASRPFAERAADFILAKPPERPPSPPKVPHFQEAKTVSLLHALVGVPYRGGTQGVIRRASQGSPPIYLVAFPQLSPDDNGLHEIEEIYLDLVRSAPSNAPKETPPIFHEHDFVALKREVPGLALPAGAKGTVHLMRRGIPPFYLVEFAPISKDDDGLHDISESDLRLVQAAKDPRPWD